MNGLPVVTICRVDSGKTIRCSCGFEAFRFSQIAADQVAIEHRASHGKGR